MRYNYYRLEYMEKVLRMLMLFYSVLFPSGKNLLKYPFNKDNFLLLWLKRYSIFVWSNAEEQKILEKKVTNVKIIQKNIKN